ncbi:MAG: ATP synthase F1 subunit delta [Bacteroidales bacterium]|nr:ATP synthase F1 subunit delta [Bacteroidales bacterium]
MDQGRITLSYARALLQWSSDKGVEHEVYTQSNSVISLVKNNPDFILLLQSTMITASKKLRTTQLVMEKTAPLLSNFVALAVKNGRENQLKGIMLNYQKLYRDKHGIILAGVESPADMNSKNKEGIKKFLSNAFNQKIEIEFAINPSLIGGFVLTIDDKLLDKSVKGELNKLQKKLMGIVQ